MAGNDGGAFHRGALKRVDDGDVVSGVSAPNPTTDEDVGGTGVIAWEESSNFSSGRKTGGDGATVKSFSEPQKPERNCHAAVDPRASTFRVIYVKRTKIV